MINDFMIGPFIVMYHSIADNSDEAYTVSVEAFREQISWLLGNGFEFVSLSFLLRSIQARNYSILRKKVVITFDDGYKDFIINALPILLDRKVPATVFIVTDMLGGRSMWQKSGTLTQLMTEDEVRYIKTQGISLGSHTATHTNLTLIDREDVSYQLRVSHERLTDLGETFYAFSYPWGQWSSQISSAVKASGYECALTVVGEMLHCGTDIYCLPRLTMRADLDPKSFQALFDCPIVKRVKKVGHVFKKCFS